VRAKDYNRGFGIIRHNSPKVAANHSFSILQNLASDNKAMPNYTEPSIVVLRQGES